MQSREKITVFKTLKENNQLLVYHYLIVYINVRFTIILIRSLCRTIFKHIFQTIPEHYYN
jgi:hypothetical protein